jgi:acyl-CoA thioester hydrolase
MILEEVNMTYEHFLTVRGYELDSFGHVNNAVYLNYLEQARWEIFRDNDLLRPIKKDNLFLVVIEVNIRYIKEINIFDRIVIKTGIKKEGSYLVFMHEIRNVDSNRGIAKANVKTLLVNQDRVVWSFPKSFLQKFNINY